MGRGGHNLRRLYPKCKRATHNVYSWLVNTSRAIQGKRTESGTLSKTVASALSTEEIDAHVETIAKSSAVLPNLILRDFQIAIDYRKILTRDRLRHGVTAEEKEYFERDCKEKLEYMQRLEAWRDKLKPKADNWKLVRFPIVYAPPKGRREAGDDLDLTEEEMRELSTSK